MIADEIKEMLNEFFDVKVKEYIKKNLHICIDEQMRSYNGSTITVKLMLGDEELSSNFFDIVGE